MPGIHYLIESSQPPSFIPILKKELRVMGKIPIPYLKKKQNWVKSPGPLTPSPGLLSTSQWITCSPPPSTTVHRLFLSSFTLKGLWVPATPLFCRTSSCRALWLPGDGDRTTSVLAQSAVVSSSGDICQPRPLSPNFPGS